MSKQKVPMGASKDASSTSEVNDPRFSNFSTDPRFRLPSKKQTRTKIDKRFSRMLKDEDFSNSAKVDRYGRKLSGSGKKKALERLYVDEDEEDEDSGSEKENEEGKDVQVEDDEVVEKELRRAATGYDAARGGGFSSSEDEDEDEDGGVDIEEEATFPDMQAEQQAVEMGEVSARIAVVNLDWDNIRSVDLMAVFQSFVNIGGKIHKISVYQSEYGKERMEREELEGPPKEIFAKKQEEDEDDEEDSEDEEDTDDEELDEKIKKDLQKGDDGNEFDSGALRQYQLERLRYFYAVVVCSDEKTAENIYQKCDGTEYLGSANFFDLRFIPDGTEFDDKPRDECTKVPTGYKPMEFVTDALQHSKVKLTWDMNPEEASRKDAINKAFTGSRADIGENDLRAYLGSDSEDDEEEEEEEEEAAEEDTPKLSKKELERQKLRAALGLGDEPTKKKKNSGPVGDMEVTFTAGLTASTTTKGNVFENEPIPNETTAEAYIRKEKDRKARRKEKAKAVREGKDPNASDDEEEEEVEAKEDLGFDDPFFATDEATKAKAAKSLRKEVRKKKHEAKLKEAEEKASNRAQLQLLMQDNSTDKAEHLDHFDIAEIQRAEKAKKKNRGKGKKGEEVGSKRGGLQEKFEMDVGDERFGNVFKNHEYAIDPSNPKFKGTDGMKRLLEEGRRKRGGEDDGEIEVKDKNKKRKVDGEKSDKGDLSSLVEKVRKKSKLAR
ncbi:putative Pre-rRNA-processing protein esf1 [Sclerotinia borealis F-4128]|uniref:Putative Pre-rRNA-processing protein esf1 n=1 Tax=Sclerotinia borealis (strain F-4128) TaxID=1432307 RepID=W9C7I1_SCLBF|nr:putative Pre-rRNA-processing protein esf1 [Sclerotinia borealis F-4128]